VESSQLANSGTAQGLSNQLTGNAASVYGSLEPQLQAEAAAPSGYTPSQIASQNTAAQQSAGGTQAGAVGAGGLYSARTRNAGGAQAAIGSASRAAGANLSKAAVGTQVNNANLQQSQRQSALGGLEGLNSTEMGGGLNALGLSNQALAGADQSAVNNPWMKLLTSGIGAGGQAAQGYFQGQGPCWIAAELYGGWNDPRTIIVRQWIFGEFSKSAVGSVVCKAYSRFGERIAAAIHARPILRKPFKVLFDCALRRAQK
jgi:hypothetical protein